jgi:hypothetical protein
MNIERIPLMREQQHKRSAQSTGEKEATINLKPFW